MQEAYNTLQNAAIDCDRPQRAPPSAVIYKTPTSSKMTIQDLSCDCKVYRHIDM
jgi:hypothetical protein